MTTWTASQMGKKGGRSKSPRKMAAMLANLQRAIQARRKPDDQIQPASLKRRQKRAQLREEKEDETKNY